MRPLFRRAAGWMGADGNPLRRPMDKFECMLRVAFVLGFLIAAPLIAPATAHQARVAGMREVQQEASWRQVSAVLLRAAPPQFYGYGSMTSHWVAARWRSPSGVTKRGMVPARSGEQAGTKVSIWVDWKGRMTDRAPMTAGMVQVRTVLTGVGSVAALAVALFVLTGIIRILLNRRRMTYWGIEWACFGPRWSARRWPRS